MTTFLLWLWLAYLAAGFAAATASPKEDLSEAENFRVVVIIAWLASNITAVLIFLASR